MADPIITQDALDDQDKVAKSTTVGEDVVTTDEHVQADGDYLYLKMAGMIPITQATIKALQDGNVGGGTAPGNASSTTAGLVKQAAAQANSTATDVAGLVTDFNALLAKLRTAGILAS